MCNNKVAYLNNDGIQIIYIEKKVVKLDYYVYLPELPQKVTYENACSIYCFVEGLVGVGFKDKSTSNSFPTIFAFYKLPKFKKDEKLLCKKLNSNFEE
jgi:hypothetical protein